MWEQLEREKAAGRKKEATGHVEKFPEGESGRAREKVGEKIGVSGRTYEKGKPVKERADEGDETALVVTSRIWTAGSLVG